MRKTTENSFRIFGVSGSFRTMNCRTQVKKVTATHFFSPVVVVVIMAVVMIVLIALMVVVVVVVVVVV